MKLWILIPCVLVGNAFADGLGMSTSPQQAQSSPQMYCLNLLQEFNKTMATLSPIPAAKPAAVVKTDKELYPFGHLTEPMGYLAFAAIVKYQYPGNDGRDDMALAKSAVAAYPVYAPIVQFPSTK